MVTKSSSIFWNIMPCSPVKINRRFGGHIHIQGREAELCLLPVSCWFLALLNLRTLKIEAICSPERSVDFHRVA
jgi:hypothetical protein